MDLSHLTEKQRRFVEEYLVDLNARQAAIRAGYSENTAKEIGYENLTKPHIQDAIQHYQLKRSSRVQVKADDVLRELMAVALFDIGEVFDLTGESPVLLPASQISERARRAIQSIQITPASKDKPEQITIKVNDKLRALELLGKHLGMFLDRTEHTGRDGGPIQFLDVERPADVGSDRD